MIKQRDFKVSDHKVLRLMFETDNLNLAMFQFFTDEIIPENAQEFSSAASSVNFGMIPKEIDFLLMFLKSVSEETIKDSETE